MKNQGFTLLELLISITVIAILTSISFWGYNAKKDTLVLRDEVGIIASKTENMRERAIGSQYWHEKLPSGGYGMFFTISNDNQYITFADCDSNELFDSNTLPCGIAGGFRERIETTYLNDRLKIKDINVIDIGGEIGVSELTIVYKFPFPKAVIKDETGNTFDNANIVVGIPGRQDQEKTIYFNSAGLIYVQ